MWLKYMSVSIQNDIGHCNDAQFFCDARTEFLNIILLNFRLKSDISFDLV